MRKTMNPRQHNDAPYTSLQTNAMLFAILIHYIYFTHNTSPRGPSLSQQTHPAVTCPILLRCFHYFCLFRRSVLVLLLALLELLNLLFHSLVYPALQFGAVAEREEDLEPDEEGCEEDGLYQIVKQRRGPSFKLAMSDKLCDPASDVDCASPRVRS